MAKSSSWRPPPSSPAASATGRANPRRDTRPETRVRSILHTHGLRFRKDVPIEAGGRKIRPDIVFPRQRLAVFIDGCFWHRCPQHAVLPKANRGYWEPKLRRNVERDREADEALVSSGWQVLRIWEHVPVEKAVSCIQAALEHPQDSAVSPNPGVNGTDRSGADIDIENHPIVTPDDEVSPPDEGRGPGR